MTGVTILRYAGVSLAAATTLLVGCAAAPPADAEPSAPTPCNHISCVPGITRDVVKGDYCPDPNRYVFAVTVEGQLFFCGSPRGFTPRYFRSPQLAGIRNLGDSCEGEFNQVAQAPDGLYLLCAFANADEQSHWVPGNYSDYRKVY
ncbi:hypothetical protein [Mycolicibacter heraklionensis]|uniref:hypothetical protein n=1 Tax=Mycolicibacter heraklionensis TaxID=512402 RepID=UPI0009E5988C|nr:hypothetical protein [Mycolicibacter heraklionensis]